MRLRGRGFTYARGSGGGSKSNGRSKNSIIVAACPKKTERCGERRKAKATWAAKIAEKAQRCSTMKATQELYLLIIVGNVANVQKAPRVWVLHQGVRWSMAGGLERTVALVAMG